MGSEMCIRDSCPVYLVNCTDENLSRLQEIQRGKAATIALLDAYQNHPETFDGNLASDASIAFYYRRLYRSMNEGAQDYPLHALKTSLFDLLAQNSKYADEDCDEIENYFLYQAFKTAGQAFSVFDEDTTDVLVPYGAGKTLIADLCSQRGEQDIAYRTALLHQANDYTVSLYAHQKKQLEKQGALIPICGGCVFALQEDFYDDTIGLKPKANTQAYWEV